MHVYGCMYVYVCKYIMNAYMMNMNTLLLPIQKKQQSAFQPNDEPNVEFHRSQ